MPAQTARRAALTVLRRIRVGQLTIHDHTGEVIVCGPGGDGPRAEVFVRDERAWRLVLRGSRGIVDGYVDGWWDTPDLTAVFRVAARNIGRADRLVAKLSPIRTPWLRLRSGFVRNTPSRSRKDISAHYDLGNDMFALWLDPRLMYSCAFFAERDTPLAEAAEAKLEATCRKLDLRADDHLLEIGTGWGGFAVYAATTRGCRVTTTTISREQYDEAVARVKAAGVDHLVEVRLDDYRELTGTYDKLVSIEMIEAVGYRDFDTFFARCSALLKPDGLMVLQAITIDDRSFEISKDARSFIRTYIFPNGCLPSVEVMAHHVKHDTDMRTLRLDDYADHYAETLRRWRNNFEAATDALDALGYDERFRRLWRAYLCYCEAGFDERHVGLVQLVLAKPLYRADGVPERATHDAPTASSVQRSYATR
ncbi:MAG TPA: cyclopropane-fatty-acyl-phospholipid synthase family protein [Acidimicrobiales bacterium]|nr:cyclopropane-fatty-acyl-phospholipid synthase family protein [Acidimicrobiales bacterium]